uniref:Sulfotransferase domain-containing protein n=1 Tax=Craspedostauros australis TaxID=1486917 RepID=A0A7R9ZTF0_9STRA
MEMSTAKGRLSGRKKLQKVLLTPSPTNEKVMSLGASHFRNKRTEAMVDPIIATNRKAFFGSINADIVNDGRKKPKFFLHIGPSKTATTTIQKDLVEMFKLRVLQQDNYAYWGRYGGKARHKGIKIEPLRKLFENDCQNDLNFFLWRYNRTQDESVSGTNIGGSSGNVTTPLEVPECIVDAKAVLDVLRLDQTSLIASDEAHSYFGRFVTYMGVYRNPNFFSNMHAIFEGWDVVIVIAYRRMFEWMLSCVKETNAKIGLYEKYTMHRWPAERGLPMQQPWPQARDWTSGQDSTHFAINGTLTDSYMYMDGSTQMWREGGFEVRFLNVHAKRHITQQLVCDIIEDAPKSCKYLEGRSENPVHNSRDMQWYIYNQIIYAGASRYIIGKGVQREKTRIQATDELVQYHQTVLNKTIADLPLACPTDDDLDSLLNASLRMEEEWMPQWYASPQAQEAHRSSFRRLAYDKLEFCSIDTKRLFEGVKIWTGLLEALNETSSGGSDGRSQRDWSIHYGWDHFRTTTYPNR